jgi:Holliday junction resolvase RusA-like endonuclease
MTKRLDQVHVAAHNGSAIQGLIHGPLPGKSNQRRIIRGKARGIKRYRPMISIKSQDALDWTERFTATAWDLRAKRGFEPLAGRLYLTVEVYPENMRRDLDIELLCDALQRSGIIKNDRDIWQKSASRKDVDKVNPRVWFELGVMGGGK